MRTLKKRESKTEYIKRFLTQSNRGTHRCQFCKYHILNYIDVSTEAHNFFKDKCKHCIEPRLGRKIPYWCKDNFKPLYTWEPAEKE